MSFFIDSCTGNRLACVCAGWFLRKKLVHSSARSCPRRAFSANRGAFAINKIPPRPYFSGCKRLPICTICTTCAFRGRGACVHAHSSYFELEVPRMRIGKRQTIETLINEEALLLAKFLRGEWKTWTPRIVVQLTVCDFMHAYDTHAS